MRASPLTATARAAAGTPGWPAAAAPPGSRRRAGLAVLVAFWLLPALAFSAMTAAGHPPLLGDDVLQNYPLRVLAGELLRHGHLPLWNPYIWSGTPLLAGSNAGAAYPGVLLFVVLPGPWAWTANIVAVYGLGGTGMYRYVRSRGLAAGAAFGGAFAFAFGGYLTAQFVHLGLVQGVSLVPWLLLAARRLDRPGRAAAFGALFGLVVLTGEPRAATIAAAAVVLAAAEALWLGGLPRRRYLIGAAAGLALGLALSAVYWLPALADVYHSQRGHATFQFYSSGSMEPQWLSLLVLPFLMGSGAQLWPQFFGSYSLTEISGYAGVLALVAAGALLPALRRSRGRRELGFWYALLAVGALLTLGGNTPLGHLLADLPVYGGMRLQSRNLGLVDLALAGLLAHWLDRVLAAEPAPGRPPWRRLAGHLLPAGAAAVVVALVLAAPVAAARVMLAPTAGFAAMWPYYVVALLLLAGGGWLAANARRWPRTARRRALLGFLTVDLALVVAGVGWSGPTPGAMAGQGAQAHRLAALLPAGERYAVYDPWRSHPDQLVNLAAPDLGVLRGEPSVQGYGSVVRGAYDAATGTHLQDSLYPSALASSTMDRLGLGLLLAPAGAFVVPAGAGEPSPPGPVDTPVVLPPHGGAVRYLGTPLGVSEVVVSVTARRSPARLAVAVQDAAGAWRQAPAALRDGIAVARLRPGPPAVAVRVANPGAAPVTVQVVDVLSGAGLYSVDGPLAGSLHPGHWAYLTRIGSYAVYRNLRVAPAVTLRGGRRARVRDVRLDGPPWVAPSLTVSSAAPVVVVRDEAYSPGWVALLRGPSGRQVRVPVRAAGLLQAVRVPAGTWHVTYEYRPRLVQLGGLVTAAGLVVLALSGLAYLRRRM